MIEHPDPLVKQIGIKISDHLAEIEEMFKPGVMITLMVRHPSHPDGSRDMLVTNDTIDDAIAAIKIQKERPWHKPAVPT